MEFNLATGTGRTAERLLIPVILCRIAFIGIHRRYVTPVPIIPDMNPMITVSALNMLDTLPLEAPIALSMPISLVLSWTEMSVMTPIIIEETIREIDTNAIST